MNFSTTNRFEFLRNRLFTQDVYVGRSRIFSDIIHNMRFLYSEIYQPDADELQNQVALLLRFELQKWLTSPLIPDVDFFQRYGLLNGSISDKWGGRVAESIQKLKKLFFIYSEQGSVLNNEFVQIFSDLYCEYPAGKVKIWCNRKERDIFIDLLKDNFEPNDIFFIHSLAEYRRGAAFDVLVRFGPFRTAGMASCPSALVTSPCYNNLVRFRWDGLLDEKGFASDPICDSHDYFDIFKTREIPIFDSLGDSFNECSVPVVEDLLEPLQKKIIFGQRVQKCICLEFPDDCGVLMRPGTNLLVFNPELSDEEAIGYRYAADINSSYYLIHYDSNIDLGDVSFDASKAIIAPIWKRALADIWERDPVLCVKKVRFAGIDIQDIERALNSWSAMNGTVIRAPRSKNHFEALITKVLDPNLIPAINEKGTTVPGWRLAWAEIEASRVEAIQHGTIEHAIVNEQLVMELNSSISIIRQNISSYDTYSHVLKPTSGLEGVVTIKPISGITSDLYAPVDRLGKIVKLPIIEQYCVERGAFSDANDPEIY